MNVARLWSGWSILACWVASAVGVWLLRWAMLQGVYRISIETGTPVRQGGLWPREVVTLSTLLAAGILLSVLSGLTVTWFAGRKDRRAFRGGGKLAHRRILM